MNGPLFQSSSVNRSDHRSTHVGMGSLIAASLLLSAAAAPAKAIEIPVVYQTHSWLPEHNPDPNPIAIATLATGNETGTGQNLAPARQTAQTFTTTEAFTLDKIWIKYYDIQPNAQNYTMRVRLFEVADPKASNLPANPVDLFSQEQMHQVPDNFPNNAATLGNYAIFDVEDILLKADTSYAFQLILSGSNASNYAYRWMVFGNANSSGRGEGAMYRVDLNPDRLGSHYGVFALQFLPAVVEPDPDPDPESPRILVPEPASAVLGLLGTMALLAGRRRGGSVES